MSPRIRHFVTSLPPEGARIPLGAARQDVFVNPHARHFVTSLPPEGVRIALGAARQEMHP